MTKRSKIHFFLLTFALLLTPGLAAAESTAAAPAVATPDLAFLSCPAAGTEAAATLAVTPAELEGAVAAQAGGPGCCAIAERQCRQNCRATGVFEFSCDPTTCQSSCICNIGP
jgi:hypothetical protein